MNSAQLWRTMKDAGAVWEHPGDPRAPHVILRSGKHSDGFVNTLRYLSDTYHLLAAAEMLAEKLKQKCTVKIDWIIGSPMAGITLATILAPRLKAKRIGFTEKVKGSDTDLICRFDIPPGNNFLMVEEMTTTGATPQRGIDAVLKKNPGAIPLDFVGAFLIRCDAQPPELLGRELASLVSLPELGVHYGEWDKADCPLCLAGSQPLSDCKRVWKGLLQTMADPTFAVK